MSIDTQAHGSVCNTRWLNIDSRCIVTPLDRGGHGFYSPCEEKLHWNKTLFVVNFSEKKCKKRGLGLKIYNIRQNVFFH